MGWVTPALDKITLQQFCRSLAAAYLSIWKRKHSIEANFPPMLRKPLKLHSSQSWAQALTSKGSACVWSCHAEAHCLPPNSSCKTSPSVQTKVFLIKVDTPASWEGLVLQVACKAKFCLRMWFTSATMKWDIGKQTTSDPKILALVTQFPSFHCCQLQITSIFCFWCLLLGCWRTLQHLSGTQELQRHGNRRASWDTADSLSKGWGVRKWPALH